MVIHATPGAQPACLRALPAAPASIPAAVALDAGCGQVVFEPGGRVRLTTRQRVSSPPGAQSAAEEGVTFRDGHVVWVRAGRVVWRSRRTFRHRRTAMSFTVISAATSSERRLAYVVSRWSGHPRNDHRLLFVTDGAGEEHLLKTAAYPLGWTPRGVITAGVAWSHVELRVWRADGRPVAPTRTMRVSASIWDWSTNRFYAISHGRVIRSDGISATSLARVQSLGFAGPSLVFLSSLGNGLIEVSSTSRLVLLDAAGRTRFRAKLPRGWRLGGSIAAERDGTVAYEAVPSTKQAARHFRLYAALPGGRPRLLDRYDVAPACVPHSLQLRGSAVLLYASDGFARLYDARVSSAPADLAPAMRWLRARHRTGQPSFA